ncbi:UNVERIFIED_CONTAM: hypothetical protein GTU68_048749 [Idotea baltica]|nr:hypothetical protein [Idotea baltica]
MTLLDEELKELRSSVEKQIPFSTLEACVRAMVRVKIQPTKYKQIIACFQFPDTYPNDLALVELRSKYISQKLSDGLTKLCEGEIKKMHGKPQVMKVLKFVSNFIDENPLCCCSEEISCIRKLLIGNDELKLRQKSSSVLLKVLEGNYVLKYNITVPKNYPDSKVEVEEKECNYPPVFRRWFKAQSLEVARRCVMPPARKSPKDPPFVLKPSLQPVISFLLEEAHNYPKMDCTHCGLKCFPDDPNDVETDELKDMFSERVYCGHIYHYKCLDTFIRTPPFQGGKKCHSCGLRIYHEKWKITTEVAEKRWAHKQAKQRELDEVVDFLS